MHKPPALSGWKKKIIQGQVLASQQKNTFEFKRPFAEGIIISRTQQALFFLKKKVDCFARKKAPFPFAGSLLSSSFSCIETEI